MAGDQCLLSLQSFFPGALPVVRESQTRLKWYAVTIIGFDHDAGQNICYLSLAF